VVFWRKARRAGNGPALVKRRNAAAGHHGSAPRVGLSAPPDGVAALAKGRAIRGEPRLARNADRPTEGGNITLKEY